MAVSQQTNLTLQHFFFSAYLGSLVYKAACFRYIGGFSSLWLPITAMFMWFHYRLYNAVRELVSFLHQTTIYCFILPKLYTVLGLGNIARNLQLQNCKCSSGPQTSTRKVTSRHSHFYVLIFFFYLQIVKWSSRVDIHFNATLLYSTLSGPRPLQMFTVWY